MPRPQPRKNTEREIREGVVKDADKTDGSGRDLVHGQRGTIDLPTKPGDLSRGDWERTLRGWPVPIAFE